MDTDNSQIYKIAKYLDKYTKDDNKKGSMYLQKLNNYLHKVQHGGSNMQIVKEIQRMVGQVIGKHHHEEEALTDKLQELGRMHSLDQPVNYESVKLKLEEKIKDAPVAQQAQTKSPTALVAQQTQSFSAPEAPVVQQAELTPDKIQNMTFKEFATIAVKRADITSVKAVDNVEKILKDLTFEQLTEDYMTLIFNKVVFFQISPQYIEPIIKQLVAMKAEIETEYKKLSIDSPTGPLIEIFKNSNSSTPAPVEPYIFNFEIIAYNENGHIKTTSGINIEDINSIDKDKLIDLLKKIPNLLKFEITPRYLLRFTVSKEEGKEIEAQYSDLVSLVDKEINERDTQIMVNGDLRRIFILPTISSIMDQDKIKKLQEEISKKIKEIISKENERKQEESRQAQEQEKLRQAREREKKLETLTTDKFDVVGYIVGDDGSSLGELFSDFIHKQEKVQGQKVQGQQVPDQFLDGKYRQTLLETLDLSSKLSDSDKQQYKLTGAGIRLVLREPTFAMNFVSTINKTERIMNISNDNGSNTMVRLFIKPATYSLPDSSKEDREKAGLVSFAAEKVNKEISRIIQPPQAGPQPPQASSAPAAAPQPQIPSPENLTTNAFVVVGHIVVDSQTNFLGKRYDFPRQKETINIDGKNVEIDVLQKDYRKNILDELVLEDNDVNSSLSYKVTKGVKIVLQSQENIKKFVDSINKHKRIVNNLPIGIKQEKVSVRLFVKPMSYKDTKDPIQLAINELERNIDAEINAIVMASASSQAGPALSAQPKAGPASSASEPTTKQFDVVGFYIDRYNSVKRFRIPTEQAQQEKVLDLFTKSNPSIYDNIQQINRNKRIEFIDDKNPEGSEEKSEDKKKRNVNRARITFSKPLPVRTTLESVNNRVPLEPVVFEFTSKETISSYDVYMFIVPIENSEDEMAKIEVIMKKIAPVRQRASSASVLKPPASSTYVRQPPASSAQTTTVRQQQPVQSTAQPASSIPRGRGASNASKGGSRGPYRHPNEEYNL